MAEREFHLIGLLIFLIGIVCLIPGGMAQAQEAKTVIGPSNPELNEGAEALLAGDTEKGIRLTMIGLRRAANERERVAALSNLCAGHVQLAMPEQAIPYCNEALEQNDRHWRAYTNRALAFIKLDRYDEANEDLDAAEAIAPNARHVKAARAMLRDAVDPVVPSIVIDDRRQPVD